MTIVFVLFFPKRQVKAVALFSFHPNPKRERGTVCPSLRTLRVRMLHGTEADLCRCNASTFLPGLTRTRLGNSLVLRRTTLVSRILCLLMCCQVLACPALCVTKRALSWAASMLPIPTISLTPTNTVTSCHCCHEVQSTYDDSNHSQQRQKSDDSSDCPDCFCSGCWVLVKASASVIEFVPPAISFVSFIKINFVPPRLASHESTDSSRPLYGRDLLRRYCVYLL
jgi:hypothetical protein